MCTVYFLLCSLMRCCFTRVHVHSSSNCFHCHSWVYKVVSLHCLEVEKDDMCVYNSKTSKSSFFLKYSANGLKDPTSTELLTFYLLLKFVYLHFWFLQFTEPFHKLVCSQNYQLCKIVLPPPICSLLLPGYVTLLSCLSANMSITLFVFCRQFVSIFWVAGRLCHMYGTGICHCAFT